MQKNSLRVRNHVLAIFETAVTIFVCCTTKNIKTGFNYKSSLHNLNKKIPELTQHDYFYS